MAAAAKRRKKSKYRCGRCNRRLRVDHWVFSRHTGNRYCWPGEGCNRVPDEEREGAA